MHLQVSYYDDEPPFVAYSSPPETDADGTEREADITVVPFGPDTTRMHEGIMPEYMKASIQFSLTLGEAEELALRLMELVLAAREGKYSEYGLHMVEFSRKEDLRNAWLALGMTPPDDDD
ncbi:hypothetical protein A5637_20705 [Mycolicibacterium fortuitum]|uniref:hypothetical protein n=1 Tax=Mycolicibacterium fortuitum TaxID=1766 RepID=UPI0007ECB5AB|nr:hypothetical protein [Mycolicibacterium fortuitum]OBK12977.1 hypothetical protein A5637_20705 [Mycolicibacterium fortuitum]